MDEWAHVPDMHFACLAPARDIIRRRWWGEWLPGMKRLCAHAIYATKMWYGTIFEDGVLVQVVTVITIVTVVVIVALWQCEHCGGTKRGETDRGTYLLRLFAFCAAAPS